MAVLFVWLGHGNKRKKAVITDCFRLFCGSWGIRTPDPLLVRQMLWTSWAKLPNEWLGTAKVTLYFETPNFYWKNFQFFLFRCTGHFPYQPLHFVKNLTQPSRIAPEQGLEPRTPWLTVMCSNQLSYSGNIKPVLSVLRVQIYGKNSFSQKKMKKFS